MNWTPAGVNNRGASTLNNWSQQPYPGDALSFGNNATGVFDVRMDLQLYQLDQITFTVPAPAYTLRFSSFTSYDLTGFGIENDGVEVNTFIFESHQNEFSPIAIGSAATMNFRGTSTASNSIFEVHGGFSVPQYSPTNYYDRFDGAEINFFNSSTAVNAAFNIQGAAGDGATFTCAHVNFRNSSDAGGATLNNQPGRSGADINNQIVAGFGGQTVFYDLASAGLALINNIGQAAPYPGGSGGVTNFHDSSTAGGALIYNQGATAAAIGVGVGGASQFFENASAGSSTLVNVTSAVPNGGGSTYFADDATAGNALIDNRGGAALYGGTTTFRKRSTADHARINVRGTSGGVPGATTFYDDSTAGTATLDIDSGASAGGRFEFYDRSTAASANIIVEPADTRSGLIYFNNDSTAGSAHITTAALSNGEIAFFNQATAGSANFNFQIDSHTSLRSTIPLPRLMPS